MHTNLRMCAHMCVCIWVCETKTRERAEKRHLEALSFTPLARNLSELWPVMLRYIYT